MSDDYLWDRSGDPDPEIDRMEKLLEPFRYREPRRQPARYLRWWPVAAAAVLVAGIWQWDKPQGSSAGKTSWQAVRMEGSPQLNGRAVGNASDIYKGARIETDATSRVEVRSELVGQVDLDPNSELYVEESDWNRQLLSLRHGVLHALIWAPPAHFAVDTPAARAVDLGCEYTLETQAGGDGLVTVQRGWVAFDHNHLESFIPAEAACRVHARTGPGIPWFQDAPADFSAALLKFESAESAEALQATLRTARARDALTLWHLLSRVPAGQRGMVFDRFAGLVKVPAEAQRAQVIAGDTRALDLCWDALELGDTSWWRTWKRTW